MYYFNTIKASMLLAGLILCMSFARANKCETTLLTPFRAVSNDGGGDNEFADFCPDDMVTVTYNVVIASAYNAGQVYVGCQSPLYLYAHLKGNFSAMFGASPLQNFTPHTHPGLMTARVPIDVSIAAYDQQICMGMGTDQYVIMRFVLAYYENGAFHEFNPCPEYFPPSLFVEESFAVTRKELVDCGCNNDDSPKPPDGTPSFEKVKKEDQNASKPTSGPSNKTALPSPLANARVLPNPFFGETNLELDAIQEEVVQASVFDAQGRRWLVQEIQLREGRNKYPLSIGDLPPGAYWIQVRSATQSLSLKAIKTP